MKLVLDASIALKWILSPASEADVPLAGKILWSLRDQASALYSPPHWIAEVLAVVARKEADRLPQALEVLYGLHHINISSQMTHLLAARLSVELNHHLYDTLYHAVALVHDAVLVTADERYFAKASGLGNIVLLANFESP